MTKANSSKVFGPGNPPFLDFPLTFSRGGSLTKRINGKVETFGCWDQGKTEIYRAVAKYSVNETVLAPRSLAEGED
jgi:hypothetical protein